MSRSQYAVAQKNACWGGLISIAVLPNSVPRGALFELTFHAYSSCSLFAPTVSAAAELGDE
jgi:hypothetical protein